MTLVLSTDSLCGNDVRNTAGDSLGELKEIMLDTEHGRIAYGVVSFGGFLGMGDKLFAVPWSSFDIDTEEHCMVLDVPKERLEKAEGFDKDHWPDFANREWGAGIHAYYGEQVYWQ